MSQPFSRILHPFDFPPHPDLEPEVKRAVLAAWTSKERRSPSQGWSNGRPGSDLERLELNEKRPDC